MDDLDDLLGIPGVVGFGDSERDGQPVLLVMVSHRTPEQQEQLPASVGGRPVVVEVVGEITPFADG